jgi:hypothetical protein
LLDSTCEKSFDEIFFKFCCFEVDNTLAEQVFSVLLRTCFSFNAISKMLENDIEQLFGLSIFEEALKITNRTAFINEI